MVTAADDALAVGLPGEPAAVLGEDELQAAMVAAAPAARLPSSSRRAAGRRRHVMLLLIGWAEVGEVGQQVVVRPDALRGGLPVDHEDHAGGEDVGGQDPAVGGAGRPG